MTVHAAFCEFREFRDQGRSLPMIPASAFDPDPTAQRAAAEHTSRTLFQQLGAVTTP